MYNEQRMQVIETPQEQLATFYIVDFDRTLADSEKLFNVFLSIADQYVTIPEAQIADAHEQMIRKGDSFDTAGYVRGALNDQGKSDEWDKLEKQYIHEARSLNMLLPGANELLETLNRRHLRHGILTYGNPLWQHLKLAASGFNHVHRIVTVNKEKGKLVSSWQQADGSFKLPQEFGGGFVDRIVMFDDKAVSFDGFPAAPSFGAYVVDFDNMLPSQKGTTSDNVKHFINLADAQKFVFY